MKITLKRWRVAFLAALVLGLSLVLVVRWTHPVPGASSSSRATPELAYLKMVNGWGPPADVRVLMVLMGQFANHGQHLEGVEFIGGLLDKFSSRLTPDQRAVYLSAIAALRGGAVDRLPLWERPAWIARALSELDEAKRITGGKAFIPHWVSGVVRARLPRFLGEREAAFADLRFCLENVNRSPQPGWMREVYFQLAALHRERGESAEADAFQSKSGLPSGAKPVLLTTSFLEDEGRGHRFTFPSVREAVPGRVYVLSGFDFTEYHFVVSEDRRALVAIDVGTRADSAQAAFEALKARVPDLPPLSTVFVTHAHWDHVGGHRYFRSLNPAVRFIGRGNFRTELVRNAQTDRHVLARFFGTRFKQEDVLSYSPDVTVDAPTEVNVGGTRFSLFPTEGGETEDALLVHVPELGVLFVGDVFMPYFGTPFSEDGNVDGMLSSIATIQKIDPKILLHGHEPLTRLFSSMRMLGDLAGSVGWLRDQVMQAITSGQTREGIHRANLVAPMLERSKTDVHIAYLIMRENLINRLFDQLSGYWQNGFEGLDALTDADRGEALLDYLGLSDDDLQEASARMVGEGRLELAAAITQWSLAARPNSGKLREANRLALLKLMERNQELNPFKFIVYSSQAGVSTSFGEQ